MLFRSPAFAPISIGATVALSALAIASSTLLSPATPAFDKAIIAFVHVNVVPMDSERVLRDHTVLVEDDKITRLGPTNDVKLPQATRTIDGKGELYLLPGLCDSHVHVIDPDEFTYYLANGVTTVRNMSGEPFHLYWRAEIAAGRMLAPTLVTTGPTMDGGGPEGSNRVILTDAEHAALAVDEIHAAGYDFLKIYSRLQPDVFDAIMKAAKRTGMRAVGHLPRAVGLEHALAAGQASIDHAEEYLYTFFKNAGPEKIPDAVKITREAGAWVTPTLVAYDTIGRQVGDVSAMAKRAELAYFEPAAVARWTKKESNHYLRDFPPSEAQGFRDRLAFQKELVRALHAAGVPLLAGTDAGVTAGVDFVLPGYSLAEELRNLVECGLTPYAALRTATVNPARFMGQEREVGVIAEGARADLVLLEKNPLDDVANVTRRAGVMVRGKWLPKAELDQKLDALVRLFADEAAFLKSARTDGIAAASTRWRDARQKDPNARLFREPAMNSLGYELLEAGKTDDAIAAFQLNVDAYPSSADVYDSLGEACMRKGEKPSAIRNYTRSLELNPANSNAKAMLAKLRGG